MNFLYTSMTWIIGSVGVGIALLGLFQMIYRVCISYVTEEKFKLDGTILAWVGKKIDFTIYNTTTASAILDSLVISIILLLVSLVCAILWPLVMMVVLGYAILRSLRFAHRIKSAVVGLVSKKKCLKDFEDSDKPKMEL